MASQDVFVRIDVSKDRWDVRAAAELRSLELLDDRMKALDLTIAMPDDRPHVAHQAVQESGVGRQVFEIEPHARLYLCSTPRPIGFCRNRPDDGTRSARALGPPGALGRASVDALDQHRELRRRERRGAVGGAESRPHKVLTIEPLDEQTEAVPRPRTGS
jgi:hypothetical protein